MRSIKLILIIASCMLCLTGCKDKEKNKKTAEEENKAVETKPIIAESFEFKTNSVSFENGTSVFEINIKNTANEERYINEFLIHVKDSNGDNLASLFGYVNETIEGNGERVISCSFGGDLSNYKSLEYEVLK